MKTQNNPRFRIKIIREILKNGRKLPIQLSSMNDTTAWEFLRAYYPKETSQAMGGKQ